MNSQKRRWMFGLVFAASLAGATTAWSAERLHVSVDAGVRWEDNIGLAAESVDEFDDFTTRVTGNLSYDVVAAAGREFVIRGTAFHEQVADLSDLSNTGLTVGADYRGEFGQALTAPWYSVSVEYTIASFADSEPRDGSWMDAEIVIGKRFSELFNLSGGVRYHRRWQDEDDPNCPQFAGNNNSCTNGTIFWNGDEVFDQERHSYFVHADVSFGARTSGFVEFSLVQGDEDATGRVTDLARANMNCRGGPGGVGLNSGCNVLTNDEAFGKFGPGVNDWYQVWKVDVDQRIVEVGVDHQFSDAWSLNVTAVFMESTKVENRGVSMDDYSNRAVIATLGFSF